MGNDPTFEFVSGSPNTSGIEKLGHKQKLKNMQKITDNFLFLDVFCITLLSYLGTVVGGRRGVENGPAGGEGIRIFSAGWGEALFAPGGEKGTVKLQKEP